MKILLGMSGGVDSCAAAAVLQQQGHTVAGVYLLMKPDADPAGADACRAAEAAGKLGIDFFTADCRAEFEKNVMQPFAAQYAAGKTPNPCVLCNPTVKFRTLLREAERCGMDTIATGHYARIAERDGLFRLCRAANAKDQSYFLYALGQDILSRTVYPLGDFASKEAVRAYAAAHGFSAAHVKDRQEICFLPDGEYARFACDTLHLTPEEGNFIDMQGNVLGKHRGILYYTAGQRKGLGAFGAPRYVFSICPADNTVTLCTAEERFAGSLTAAQLTFCGARPADRFEATVKIRSTARPAPAHIHLVGDTAEVVFDTPQLSVSPGQSAVFYDGEQVLGGGIIQ